MITYLGFQNYRVLRQAELKLGRLSLILGPNGSGKSTILKGLRFMSRGRNPGLSERDRTVGVDRTSWVELKLTWDDQVEYLYRWRNGSSNLDKRVSDSTVGESPEEMKARADAAIHRVRTFSLDPAAIAEPVQLVPSAEIGEDGSNLAVVLTQMQDHFPERFEGLNNDLRRWIPEFDRVLFHTPSPGNRAFSLRTERGGHQINAADLSSGTLLALCLLTLAHLPEPPSVICLEEPDHGIHPRLLRQVHDAMVRLSDPASCGDQRKPVQVIATTHSPYFLDLFRDHPEDVFLAEKTADGASFHKLTDMPHYQEIMADAPLGDAWYTGILGGVPTAP
jgi:predicted ATPase